MSQIVEQDAAQFAASSRAAGLRERVPARSVTTFGVGGTLRYLYEPQDLPAARELLSQLHSEGRSWRALGAGSNLLISDAGIEEPVIRLGRSFSGYALLSDGESPLTSADDLWSRVAAPNESPDVCGSGRCVVLAGAPLMTLSRDLSGRGFSGLEFGAGIPATLGGAVVMNAGAHGNQLSDVVQQVFALGPDGADLILTKEQLNYSYRRSDLSPGCLVLGAELLLRSEDLEIVRKRRSECLEYRRRTQPLTLPSAGSAFRNPSRADLHHDTIGELPAAAQLLEKVGLKGARRGGVAYSELHANWLVRVSDDASAEDAKALLELGIARVQAEHSVRLRPEIVWWE